MSLITDIEKLDDNLVPNVLSLSVGVTEYEYINELGLDFANRLNLEFMKLGLKGLSIICAIGDTAIQQYQSKYWINFPASSPYVTSIGGVWLGDINSGPLEVDPNTTGGFSH